MRKTALILALAIAVPAWGQDKPADKPAEKPAAAAEAAPAQEAPKADAPKAEAPKQQAKKPARKHTSRRTEDARHCLDEPTNTEIIKCAEAYL